MVTYLIDQWTFDDVPKDTIKVLGAGYTPSPVCMQRFCPLCHVLW